MRRYREGWSGAALAAFALACSSEDGGGSKNSDNTASGGYPGYAAAPNSGGMVSYGAAPPTGYGGANAAGAPVVYGGAPGAGGAVVYGGAPGAGGAIVYGGAPGAGGSIDFGGAPGNGGDPGVGGVPGGDGGSSGDQGFDACVAGLTPLCRTAELDTAAKMEANGCKATEFIPIPLTTGGSYGPKTIEGGPYGGKIDWNEGAGTPYANPVNGSEPLCLPTLIDVFAEPASVTDDLKNTRGIDYSAYTIFRPACMKAGEKYPVITWANGTCGLTHGYALILGSVSSHGFVVIASNSTWTNTAPTNRVQARAIDYAEALNADANSPLYGRLDLGNVAAMGHSQGAAATAAVASDPRVKSLVLWNAGTSNLKPFLNVSGDRDIGGSVASVTSGTNAATQPGAWVWYHQILQTGGGATGHLVLMEQPDRVWEMAVAWLKWQLKGDQTAKTMFVGDNCGLCNRNAEFEYGHNALLK